MISSLSEALAERGFDKLTPVQEAVIAPELAASDLLVSAQTGSGKTVGFGLAIAPTLLGEATTFDRAAEPLALVIAPTRELAFQVKQELAWLYARTGAVVTSCVGGMDMRDERRALSRGAHIVVGTPGRLKDHILRGSLDLSGLKAAVLDEADEMLDLGFHEDLEYILGESPKERRTLLFSATVPPTIVKLAEQYQRDAQRISTLTGTTQHADISYQAIRVAASDSEHAIFNMLRFHHDQSAIVFANTRAAVNHLSARLGNRGLATVSLSGELSQTERTHALQAMRDGRARVCVATDVAARGIDLPNLNLVIHADLPTNTESLLHRSGRTGRAGRKGISALIVPPRMTNKADRLLKWAKINAEWTEAPSPEDILRQDEERLLNDPAWDEPVTEDQSTFAAKLLERHGPEAIAAAYLRMYQSRHAAPEELLPPDSKPARNAERSFGPSRWVSLSVGRGDRAEARWLLPLLCRSGGLDKNDIGAIRVQDSETYVELLAAKVDGFLSALGADAVLEDGIAVRAMDKAPDLKPQRRGPKPDGAGPRPRRDFDNDDKPRKPRPPRHDDAAPAPRKDRAEATEWPRPAARAVHGDKPSYGDKPKYGEKPKYGDKPKSGDKPRYEGKPKYEGKPRQEAGSSAPGQSRSRDQDATGPAKFKARPSPAGKPGHKSTGPKPFGAKPKGPGKGKPAGAGDASNTSKRFVPKKPGKPAGKPRGPGGPREGGFDAPKRGKR